MSIAPPAGAALLLLPHSHACRYKTTAEAALSAFRDEGVIRCVAALRPCHRLPHHFGAGGSIGASRPWPSAM